MPKLMFVSYSGLSDGDANGITMKELLSAWKPEELCQFYTSVQAPDFTACASHFRVTDGQMLKSYFGKRFRKIYQQEKQGQQQTNSNRKAQALPGFLKRNKYNYWLRWSRELLWQIGPWGQRQLLSWAQEQAPDGIVYMVGESIFQDKLVLKLCRRLQIPLILYNCEALRVVDEKQRTGVERLFYKRVKKLYRKLNEKAALTIFNSRPLMQEYERCYPLGQRFYAYNSSSFDTTPYVPGEQVHLAYFGNLGIGRTDALLDVARVLQKLDSTLYIDVYGGAGETDEKKLRETENIHFHGFVSQQQLRQVKQQTDILLHTESFDPAITAKLRFAFSTKIAQCLCAGRCLLTYAPESLVSTRYLAAEGCAVTACSQRELEEKLALLITDGALRQRYGALAMETARKNHCKEATAQAVRQRIEACL